MRRRYIYGSLAVLLLILSVLITWQVSFDFGEFGPTDPLQTFVFWAVSTLIFVLAVWLSFLLVRIGVTLYLERQRNQEGSRFQTKLMLGALGLTALPVIFLLAFSYQILNRNVEKWFMRDVEGIRVEILGAAQAYNEEVSGRAHALVKWLASVPEVRDGTANFKQLCSEYRITALRLNDINGVAREYCSTPTQPGSVYTATAQVAGFGTLELAVQPPQDIVARQQAIDGFVGEYERLRAEKSSIRRTYLLFMLLITLFILFVATWITRKLARQISEPISAVLEAAAQVRSGNLGYRVIAPAIDEMATLVRSFNEMTAGLEATSRELENRRRFTEAILESIPTGVISLTAAGRIQRVNRALRGLFPEEQLRNATTLSDLLPAEHVADVQYLMKRARRTGVASSQMDLERPRAVLHLAVTVSALPSDEPNAPGYVVVLEDTSELLRAQKTAAWQEVARRVAHELKNPLTPIALSAERIQRQLDRGPSPESERILRQCAATITREVESVKALSNEFSQLARFPAVHPIPSSINEVVRDGMSVFEGRLEGIEVRLQLADDLPLVHLDPEQFKRVVVNLVDNAAESMRDSATKRLLVATRQVSDDAVELLVADTGSGISAGDKEKLFLPYFSTKQRGTGLGLAIVANTVKEHAGRIRVAENLPSGACFYVEMPVASAASLRAHPDPAISQPAAPSEVRA